MRPALVMTWPGAVPIHPVCVLCDSKGHKVHNARTIRSASQDGLIVCEALFGDIVTCVRCSGWGHLTRYGTRGRAFTPLVARRKSIWERLRGRVS